MEIVLVPGFWLDADSWSEVVPALEAAGHTAHPLTLPGLESRDADRSAITFRDHVEAVIVVVDSLPDPIVLVGHSGGVAINHAVVDARPDRIVRAICVDSWPTGEGKPINDQLPVVNGEIPLPDWSHFDDDDLVDLDDALLEEFRARAIPQPARVATDPPHFYDERRYDVPATVIVCEAPSSMVLEWMQPEHEYSKYLAELAAIKDFELVDLPTGHWPQFTRPDDLATAILAAIDR